MRTRYVILSQADKVDKERNLQISFNCELATVFFVIYMVSCTPFFTPVWISAFLTVRVSRFAILRLGRGDVTARTSSILILRQHWFVTAHILQWTSSLHTFHETRSSLPDYSCVPFFLEDELEGHHLLWKMEVSMHLIPWTIWYCHTIVIGCRTPLF